MKLSHPYKHGGREAGSSGRRRFRAAICALLCLQGLLPAAAFAQYPQQPGPGMPARPASARPPILDQIGIDQKLNEQVPLDLEFRDETGRAVKLRDYFGGKPVVLSLVFYECPMLCTQIVGGLVAAMRGMSFAPGDQFISLTVSFDPREKPEQAAKTKQTYLPRYGRPEAAAGWHFLTGEEPAIQALTQAVGFRYAWDPAAQQYAHASGIMVLTPEGRVSRYFYGVEYAPRDLRLGLVEASAGKIGTLADQVFLLCYHYDPETGTYAMIVMNVIRLAAVLLLIALAAFFTVMWWRNKRRRAESPVGYSHFSFAPLALYVLQFLPEQASSFAADVDNLYLFLVGLTVFFTLAIGGCELYFAVKYRRRSPHEVPPDVHEPKILEVAWIVIPTIGVVVLFFWSASLYFRLYRAPQEALEIFVTGKQWMWRAQHPDGQREINGLHLPLGRRIKLTMTSEDVIHAYYIPAFRTKADVVPGRYTTIWFETTKTGTYHLFCAEYCGTQHSGMIGSVVVMEPAAYQAWLSGGATEGSPAAAGQKLFASLACNTCHRADAQGRGPVLEGLFGKPVALSNGLTVTADETYLRESIVNPRAKIVAGYEAIMPTFQGQVSEEQILQLIAYLKSIGPQPGPAGSGAQGTATPAAAPPAPPPARPGSPPKQ
jgi:cytochrome c oxidase subunit 2